MATWNDLKAFIKRNYKINKEDEKFIKMTFETDNLRTQIVFVILFETKSGNQWVEIKSPVGMIPTSDLNDALEALDDKMCGGLVKMGDSHYVRHNLQLADLSTDEFVVPLRIVVNAADELENKFVGGDDH